MNGISAQYVDGLEFRIKELTEQVEKLTKERDIKEHCITQFELEDLRMKEQLAALAEQNEKLKAERSSVWMVANKVSMMLFATKEDAEQSQSQRGASTYILPVKVPVFGAQLPDLASPVLNRIKESNDDVLVMDALRSGEWRITKSIPCECLTDEANAKSAWYVERMCAPFCDDKNLRSWFGRTPIEALSNGKDAIRARAAELEKTND